MHHAAAQTAAGLLGKQCGFLFMQEGSLELDLPHYIQHPPFPQHRQFAPATQLNEDIIQSTVYMTTNTLLPEGTPLAVKD